MTATTMCNNDHHDADPDDHDADPDDHDADPDDASDND